MLNFPRAVGRLAFVSSFLFTFVAFGALAPQSPQKGNGVKSSLRMLDSRVNYRAGYTKASAARPGKAASGLAEAKKDTSEIVAAIEKLQGSTLPGLKVKLSEYTGGVAEIRSSKGSLTGPSGGSSEQIVRTFLAQNAATFGFTAADLSDLVVLGDSPGGGSGLRMLRMEQQIDGRPVFQSETRFILDRNGRLVQGSGRLVPHAREFAAGISAGSFMTPAQAITSLLAFEGKTVDPAAIAATPIGAGRIELTVPGEYAGGPAYARQVLFPLGPGLLVPAWSLNVFTLGDADWYAIVDAQTGALLWRKNVRNYASTHDARFRVYVQADGVTPADSPAPASPNAVAPGAGTQFPEIAPTIVSMHTAMNAIASPNGWIDDCPGGVCTAAQTQTLGNNALICLDRDGAGNNVCDISANSLVDGNGRPMGNPDANARNRDFLGTAPRDFQTNFLPAPQGGNPDTGQTPTGNGVPQTIFRRGMMTHLFYLTNWYHDKLFALGFDEASANFQQTNFTGFGLGNDRVLGDAQDASGTDNANFATFPDGTSGRMQMYRFTAATASGVDDRDGALDAEIVLHELTHGTSNRLVGNAAGLNWDPAAGMGEGWSDFYALSLLNPTNADAPTARYTSGAYATYKLDTGYLDNYVYGIRRFPYSSQKSVNPLTWADIDDTTNNLSGGMAPTPLTFFNNAGGMEVHNLGEVWAVTLWDVRARVIADPAGANGDVPTGNTSMLQLVTDGLKMTPIDPTVVDARDAILNADCATNACANEDSIWGGFANRGFGYGARAPYYLTYAFAFSSHMAFHESTSLPYLDVADPLTDVAIDDAASNNNGDIDPGEAIKLTVTLTNPWRRATKAVTGATVTLTSSTPGVTIYDGTSTYGAIAPLGSAAGDSFLITVAPSVTAGTSLEFSLAITSNLGVTSSSFSIRVGNRNGTDSPITYTNDPNPDVAIPDGIQLGGTSTMSITDDFEIADINFRLDSLTHGYDGDINVMLRSPGEVGSDLIGMVGLLLSPDEFASAGANYTNMTIDDEAPATADMFAAADSEAPYSGTWLPIYNTPTMSVFGVPGAPDPAGTLSHYDGTSTKGTWTTLAADHATPDAGTLNAWSLIVTPVHFDVVPFAAAAAVSGTKTVSGTFQVGGTVTYTVTLTNNGTANQADNTGNEFTDVLPASLTLVSAISSAGTASTAGNTVNWNGSLAPLGGSVTVTITATVNAGTQGMVISNQGTVSYDADGDDVNEASALTDDPGVGGTTDPTVFTVANANVTGTKTVSGTFTVGSTVTYTVVLTNSGSAAAADNAGDEFTDVLPAGVTLTGASATGGTTVPTVGTNTVTWNGALAAAGSVTITITATVNANPGGTTVSNQGTISYDSDLDGTNESSRSTDDPSAGGPTDPTSFIVQGATITATKTASGTFTAGSTVTYTITLSNTGSAASLDNAGNELTDVLPASLTLASAMSSAGTVSTAGNTVDWNGSVPASGSVTVIITATINAVPQGTVIANQATVLYDSDLDGTSESTTTSDDPGVAGSNNPTAFTVGGATLTATKTVSGSFVVGGTVTYTITISNSGASATADEAGNELTDVLPASLTLVNTTATSGTPASNVGTNTATWNGGVPASGSVTVTITASINSGTIGSTITNQGSLSYDSDANGSNDASNTTDDPGVAGTNDPTSFVVSGAIITGTKSASGSTSVGGTVTYTIVLSNSGNTASVDNAGNELTDVLPASLALTGASSTSGTPVATVGTNTVTWSGSVPAGGSVTITITATINSGAAGTTISNQASFSYDSDSNGTNETNGTTDDPSAGGANDATSIVVAGLASETATKTVSGSFTTGGNVTYTITINNSGDTASGDNAGNEFTDILPASLTLVSATATSGAAVPNIGTNTVTWNGGIPAGGSVTITITATIEPGNEGTTISNQGTVSYDTNGDSTNDATV
ncbi:MAG TPA: M36 family metallopeptidase, partial [Thermoanaerobaculia bacterium]|nr:M36 family metallopeptidase [Thermoanaerobaculia bacterium]